MTAYRSLASWRGDGPFGAWLTRIAVRIALRKAGRRKTVAWRDPIGPVDGAIVPDPIEAAMNQASLDASARIDPSSLAVRAERATDVRTAVADARRAVPRDRHVAVLRGDEPRGDRPGDRPSAQHRQDPPLSGPHPAARVHRRGDQAMTGPVRRFDPSEVRPDSGPGPSDAELAEAMVAARELETLIARDAVGPTVGFEDRVMAAIATEPAPRLFGRPAASVRGGWPVAFVLSIRDAWRVATSGGRPVALRAQAMAFVLLVVLATGSVSILRGRCVRLARTRRTPRHRPCPPRRRPSCRHLRSCRPRHRPAVGRALAVGHPVTDPFGLGRADRIGRTDRDRRADRATTRADLAAAARAARRRRRLERTGGGNGGVAGGSAAATTRAARAAATETRPSPAQALG